MVEALVTLLRKQEAERPDYSCQCLALGHDHNHHGLGACERRATVAGGVCTECRYWHTFPERREHLS